MTAKALLPSTSVISFTLGRGLSFTTFVNTVPLDGQRTINRFALVRRLDVDPIGASFFNSSLWDHLARQAMLKCAPLAPSAVSKHQQLCLDGQGCRAGGPVRAFLHACLPVCESVSAPVPVRLRRALSAPTGRQAGLS